MKVVQQNFWQSIKRFFEPVKANPRNFIFCGFISLLWAFHSVSYARYFEQITKAIQSNNIQDFFFRLAMLWLTISIWFIIKLGDRKIFFRAVNNADNFIYTTYITKFFFSDNTKVEKIGTGKIISILKSWVNHWSFKVTEVFRVYLNSIFIFIFSLIIIGSKSTNFLFATFFIFIIIALRISFFGPKASKRRAKSRELYKEMDRHTIKQVMSKFEVLQSNRITTEISKYVNIANDVLFFRQKEKFRQALWYDWSNFLVGMFRIVIIWVIWYNTFHWTASLSDFVLLATLTWILTASVSDLANIWKWLSDSLIHITRLRSVFDDLQTEKMINDGKEFILHTWNIVFKNVSFSYGNWKDVLSDFFLEIPWKKKTALVWVSWSWKTTIIKLASLYIKPESGSVRIDDQDLSTVKLTSYYKHIGYLTQEPNVFDWTIYENLTYALDETPDPETLNQIIKDAQCEFIHEFEDGLQTEIGEKGVRLSGGQRQRLAIAKIMLKNPHIILLDEPTSALDSFNEEKVSKALDALFKDKTVIVVAHRLQTVKQADNILLFENGQVIESWTHDELIAMGWNYKKMLDLQSWF